MLPIQPQPRDRRLVDGAQPALARRDSIRPCRDDVLYGQNCALKFEVSQLLPPPLQCEQLAALLGEVAAGITGTAARRLVAKAAQVGHPDLVHGGRARVGDLPGVAQLANVTRASEIKMIGDLLLCRHRRRHPLDFGQN